jgi:NTE family protein
VTEPLTRRPDVLCLAVGGTLGEAWIRGLLAGAEGASSLDFRDCEYFIGTSAGSIVAATLAAGKRPEAGHRAERAYAAAAAGTASEAPPAPGRFAGLARWGAAAATPLAPLALASSAPGGAIVRAAALAASPRPDRTLGRLAPHLDALDASFDGRLRIVAVDRSNGRRVVFGQPGAPQASVRNAVLASCSVPWVFAPVRIGGREYVDGGMWSPTNLDVTPVGRDTEVLCLNPTASLEASRSAFGLLRAVSQGAAAAEALVLRGRGARVRIIGPDEATARIMGVNLMDPRRVEDVLDAAFAQGQALVA